MEEIKGEKKYDIGIIGRTKKANHVIRISLIVFILSMFIFPEQVYSHFYGHFSGLIGSSMITHEWDVVLLNSIFFISFLVPLSFRSKTTWKHYGIVSAFFVSLFIEMYGIPFTILFASRVMDPSPLVHMQGAIVIDLFGVNFLFTIPMVYGTLMMAIGTIIIIVGWVTIYKKIQFEPLVTSGIYSISRHPQYLGFILVIIGWMVGWPTPLTLLFGSVLVVMYLRVCRKEESEMIKLNPDYREYMETTPFIV